MLTKRHNTASFDQPFPPSRVSHVKDLIASNVPPLAEESLQSDCAVCGDDIGKPLPFPAGDDCEETRIGDTEGWRLHCLI